MRTPKCLRVASILFGAWPLVVGASSFGCSPSAGPPSAAGPSDAGTPDTGPAAAACDLSAAVPVPHSSLGANETWGAGIHEVSSSLSLSTAGSSLTIAPCTEVRLAKDVSLSFSDGATLKAEGTEANPIRFVRKSAADPWGAVKAWAPSTASLSYATLEGGGTSTAYAQADYLGATLVGVGSGDPSPTVLKLAHVTVKGSSGLGVAMVNARFDAASAALTVTSAGWFPIYTGVAVANELPSGAYTGNGTDAILLQSANVAAYENLGEVKSNVTLHDRGVPYQVGLSGADILVGDARAASPDGQLTLEAGVVVRFSSSSSHTSSLRVNGVLRTPNWVQQGALIVEGTAAKPVTLTSAAAIPAAGDWQGLYFADVVHSASRLDHLVIQYAGGDSSTVGVCKASPTATNYTADCSVVIELENDLTTNEFITNTLIAHGLGCGFYRGWHGTDTDFRPTNTFTDIAGCSQSNIPPPGQQTCDSTVCPMP